MTDVYARALAILSRCEVWAEVNRRDGYVYFQGMRGSHPEHCEIASETLDALLEAGRIDVSVQQRLREVYPYEDRYFRTGPTEEITVKYWKVLP